MKKILSLIITMVMIAPSVIVGQSADDIYFIGDATAKRGDEKSTKGFSTFTSKPIPIDYWYQDLIITFVVNAKSLDSEGIYGVDFSLRHDNVDVEIARKEYNNPNYTRDSLVIVDMAIEELKNIKTIDIMEFVESQKSAEVFNWYSKHARRWADGGRETRIWVIDRNRFYKSSDELSAPDRMKLIEVRPIAAIRTKLPDR